MRIEDLDESWDLIVIGGGITGAGVFREAVRTGLRVLLLERRDFAWGTSSRSAKLVHGGLRYLQHGMFHLTRESVKERERLLKEAPGLVEPLGFLMPVYEGYGPGKWILEAGLSVYDLMAHKRGHTFFNAEEFLELVPQINQSRLKGGFRFWDAQVDDARLVLRLIDDGIKAGGTALNYTSVVELARNSQGGVVGVTVEDSETRVGKEIATRAVVNATGHWAEQLHPSPEPKRHLRPLRGSHLLFPSSVLPIGEAVSFVHPKDHRWVFAVPWEGSVLFGTTDVEHTDDLSKEPFITPEEVSYLMQGLSACFPELDLSPEDCVSTFAGIRPVLSEGKVAPSKESREHVVWLDKGLVTVTGGKLTTFRKLAWDTLKAVGKFLPSVRMNDERQPVFPPASDKPDDDCGLTRETWRRLYGRYGEAANELVQSASPEDLEPIPGTPTLWAEIPFTARHERPRHLTDLLLRRVRIGLLTPRGGEEHLDRIQKLCRPALDWDEERWEEEIRMYFKVWNSAYSPPVQ